VLRTVEYDLSIPHAIQFLRKYTPIVEPDLMTKNVAKYITNIGALEYSLAHYRPSVTAAVAIHLALIIMGKAWSKVLFDYGGLKKEQFHYVARQFVKPVIKHGFGAGDPKLKGLEKKFRCLPFSEEQVSRLNKYYHG
jgi:hypothetical protein